MWESMQRSTIISASCDTTRVMCMGQHLKACIPR